MNYREGDVIRYAAAGACRIVAIEERKVDQQTNRYYVLRPLYSDDARIYVPTQNTALTDKMRPMPTADTVRALLRDLPATRPVWIEDSRERLAAFLEILRGDDLSAVLLLIRTIDRHAKHLQRLGRHLHQADERVFRNAQKALYSTFAYVLGKDPEQIASMVREWLDRDSADESAERPESYPRQGESAFERK